MQRCVKGNSSRTATEAVELFVVFNINESLTLTAACLLGSIHGSYVHNENNCEKLILN